MGISLPRAARRWLAAAFVVTSLVATAGSAVADDSTLQMSGTLLDSSGSPVVGAYVRAENLDGPSQSAFTDDSGYWEIDGIDPGQYQVEFQYGAGSSWAFGEYSSETADLITVADTSVVVDDTIPAPLRVSGQITDVTTGTPLAGVCASFIDPADPDSGFGEGCSGADGSYSIDLFEPGHFAIRVQDPTGVHIGATGAPFDIAAGQQITGQNFALDLAGTVTGVVVDRATGSPLRNICPSAYLGRRGAYVSGQGGNVLGRDWPLDCERAAGNRSHHPARRRPDARLALGS